MNLRELRKYAKKLGVKIESDRDDYGWYYWLLNSATGDPLLENGNFCVSLEEVEYKLDCFSAEMA